MPKYNVKVAITYHKELEVYGKDEDEAGERAADIVSQWSNVEDAEVVDVEEI